MRLEPSPIFESVWLFYPIRASRGLLELLEILAHWKNNAISCRAVEGLVETLDLSDSCQTYSS